MPSPVGPNAPNRAFGTTPPEKQPATPAAPDTPLPIASPTTQEPPALAGGSNTTNTDRQSPTEDIAAATADPTGEHDGSGITGSHSRNV